MAQNKTILIADDSPLQAIILRRILNQAGFQVLTAKNGLEALDYLKSDDISLVISDVNMPEMNGYELCQQIKSSHLLRHIPCILCTTLSSPKDLIKGIEVGADNYVTRPYNEENLLAMVHELLQTPPHYPKEEEREEIVLRGEKYLISTSRQYILNFLLSTYQNIRQQNQELLELRDSLEKAQRLLASAQKEQEQLLLNIFPETVAQELLAYGSVNPTRFDEVSVMFIDFVGFTKVTGGLSPQQLLQLLEFYFENFDRIIDSRHLERIKTMGDGYMCAGGVPNRNATHARDCALAALEIQKFMESSKQQIQERYQLSLQVRIGINTGPIVSGVVGKKRYAYDIWGDTVNLAKRLESQCAPGHVNISATTYEKVKDFFNIEPHGQIITKDKNGKEYMIKTFFVQSVKSSHS